MNPQARAAGGEDGRADGGGRGRSEAGPMTRSARELAYQSARWAKAKPAGWTRCSGGAPIPPETRHRACVALGAGRNIAANPPVLARSSSDRRCSRSCSHPHGPRKPYPEPQPCPSSTQRRAVLEARQERSGSPRIMPATRSTSQACRASGGSRHVATNAPVVLLPAPDVFVGEAPAPPNRAHRGRNRGVIATPSCPGWGSAGPDGGRPEPTRESPSGIGRAPLRLEAISTWSQRDRPACGVAH